MPLKFTNQTKKKKNHNLQTKERLKEISKSRRTIHVDYHHKPACRRPIHHAPEVTQAPNQRPLMIPSR